MLYPLTFHPIFKERLWGGRTLETLYQKPLPPGTFVGECWEISDRPGDASVIANGPLAGKNLRWLMEHHGAELLGPAKTIPSRFPLLVKVLDAREKLSLQVHPPPLAAARLGGEPKTEMWYVTHAAPGAELFVGLKRGVTREQFERHMADAAVTECLHRVSVQAGDAMFLPSGRLHAIGGGLVLFEIQQNSDTTYRVFDWNRLDRDGKSRQLHIAESLASIDFDDIEPALVPRLWQGQAPFKSRLLVNHPLFRVDALAVESGAGMRLSQSRMRIVGLVAGRAIVTDGAQSVELSPGHFCLVPASIKTEVQLDPATTFLLVQDGENGPSPSA